MELEPEREETVQPGAIETHVDEHDRSAALAVVEAVASLRGESPVDMPVVLADAVDPDALERLVGPGEEGLSAGRVAFAFGGCHVVAHADGRVQAYRAATDGGR